MASFLIHYLTDGFYVYYTNMMKYVTGQVLAISDPETAAGKQELKSIFSFLSSFCRWYHVVSAMSEQ